MAAVVATSQVTLRVTERLIRRILPLGSLMQMSLVFPDEAPSRFSMALRTGNVEKLRRTTAEAVEKGLPSDLSEAAETALAMVAQLNRHDRGTRGHSERVRAFSEVLAEELGCSADFRDRLRWGALLHDMGKLTVPAEILNKPGKPTPEEWIILSGHPGEGERILAPLADWLGDAVHAAGQHHERWDGKGYPRGLAGEDIALSARIVSVADAFAVMTGARSYKKPLPMVKARQELTKNAGTQFDPAIVRAMLNVSIRRINVAAGPLSALANVPFIGSLIAGAPALPAAIGSGAVAVAMTSAGMIAPAISPIEWILPSSEAAPTELAFESPLEGQFVAASSTRVEVTRSDAALSFESGALATDEAAAVTPTTSGSTTPVATTVSPVASNAVVNSSQVVIQQPVAPEVQIPSTGEPGPVTSVTVGVTSKDQPPVSGAPATSTSQTTSTSPIPGQTTVPPSAATSVATSIAITTTVPPVTKPPQPTVTTTIASSETIPQTLPPVTFPPSETTPPIIATTSITIDPESTKVPPKPALTTTQPPPPKPTTTVAPPSKPWIDGPGGTVVSE